MLFSSSWGQTCWIEHGQSVGVFWASWVQALSSWPHRTQMCEMCEQTRFESHSGSCGGCLAWEALPEGQRFLVLCQHYTDRLCSSWLVYVRPSSPKTLKAQRCMCKLGRLCQSRVDCLILFWNLLQVGGSELRPSTSSLTLRLAECSVRPPVVPEMPVLTKLQDERHLNLLNTY